MPKQKVPKGAAASSEVISDPRFTNFATDPRYRLPSRKQTRTKVDKRFSRMLTDEDFTNTAAVDRYGRKISKTGKKKALERLYRPAESDEDEDSDVDITQTKLESASGKSSVSGELDNEIEDDEVVENELNRAKYQGYDAARGGGFSSSSEDEEDESDGGVEVEEEAQFPEAQEGGVPLGDVSKRIAVVNLDWDNIRAADLMAVFSSFVRAGGQIEKISVYPSEFGRERMEREEMEGPPKEIFAKQDQSGDDSDEHNGEDEDDADERIKNELIQEDDGQEFDSAQLRQYQLERLRYYYAVIICSDEETATKIYEATDGTEYLSSANFFDLRFIPDGVDFDEKPRDECTSVPSGYRPTDFVTDALQHSKVKLTWDAEDTTRKDVIKKAFSGSRTEIGENDLKAYLGSDSSDNDEEGESQGEEELETTKLTKKELARQKMRAALGLSTEPEPSKKDKTQGPVGDIEVTFTPGLSSTAGTSGKANVFLNQPLETTAEAYVRKERERKARRKEKAKAIREGRDPNALDTVAAAEEKEPEDLGFEDPFFTTDEKAKEKVKKTQRKEDRQKKRSQKEAEEAEKAENRAELELLMSDAVGDIDHLDHFDIKAIARAEKLKNRKGKKGQSKKGKSIDKEIEVAGKRGGMQEDFEMNVADPRFKAVFEENEFAIDPSNPSFKGTGGMKKLLEEGRKRRRGEERDGEVERPGGKKRKGGASGDKENEVGLGPLVEMVKKRAKK